MPGAEILGGSLTDQSLCLYTSTLHKPVKVVKSLNKCGFNNALDGCEGNLLFGL